MINFLRAWKFILGFLAIISASLVIWYLTMAYAPEARQAREARDYLEQLQAEYANDTYGGATPEETLELFISALEKGNIELASKYFVSEKQKEWEEELEKFQKNGLILELKQRLGVLEEKYPLVRGDSERFIFEAFDKNGELILQVDTARIPSGIWKIIEM